MRHIGVYLSMLLTPVLLVAQGLEDVSNVVGEQNFSYSTNMAWADYNNDGHWDLYITNWGGQADLLVQNVGDGSFVRDAQALANSFVTSTFSNSTAAGWADFDNDGNTDLYVADFYAQDLLFKNIGGSFREVGNQIRINAIKQGSSTAMAWADYNNDGYLDIYLGKYYFNNEVYQNNGDADGDGGADGTFTLATDLGINDARDTDEVLWADYDNDGDVDLYVVNREQENALYRNDLAAGGLFADIACALSVDNKQIGQGGAWADYDNDGDMDLYLASVGANALYRNDGNEQFTEIAQDAGVVGVDLSYWMSGAVAWTDLNGDGFSDLYVANGGDKQPQPDFLYIANGDGTFREATGEFGLRGAFDAHTAVGIADFNGDGAPDFHLADGWGQGNQTGKNTAATSNFVRLRLVGKGPENGGSNRDAIGARVRMLETASGVLVGTRQLLSTPNAPELIFGTPAGPYDLEVTFPSGIVVVESGINGGDFVTVVEP